MSYHCSSPLFFTKNNNNDYLSTKLNNIFSHAQIYLKQYYQYYNMNNFYQKRYPIK